MLNAPNVEHLYVLGDKDVMPKGHEPGSPDPDLSPTTLSLTLTTTSLTLALSVQVIPSDRPLTYEWLEELGAFLLDRGWLSRAERATWDLGGFFWRRIHSTGLCAIGLNSQLWSATPQGNHTMRRAQLAWLPGVLGRQANPNPNP